MLSLYSNFQNHAEFGTVPTHTKNFTQVPINNFYESLDHVGSVLLPMKKTMCYLAAISATVLTNIVLQPLYLAFAYLSYLSAKLVSNKTEGNLISKGHTESLARYSNMLFHKASDHSDKVGKCVDTVFSYAFTFVIWTVAFVLTPADRLCEKVASKFSKPQPPEPANGQATEEGAAPKIG